MSELRHLNVAAEIRRVCAMRDQAVAKLAAQVRRDLVVPLCRRYRLRFNVHSLAALDRDSDGCYAFVTERGEVIRNATQARRLGVRLGRAFVTLARSVEEPGMFGGDAPLGNFVRPYPKARG